MGANNDRCELNPDKTCDNCFQCLEPSAGQDYASIEIAAVYTHDDYIGDGTDAAAPGHNGNDSAQRDSALRQNIRTSTLSGLKGRRRLP